jgi:lysophospholipase L1-like esterase
VKRLAAAVLGLLAGLLACEGATRLFADRLLSLSHPTVRFDPELAWVQRAGTTDVRHNEAGEEIAIAGTAFGIRQPPAPYRFQPGRSVLVLGDSLTAGTQVRFEDTWCAQLLQRLRRRHPDLEIVNAGIDRYDLAQEYRLARRLWSRVRPRHVIAAVYVGNDVVDYERDAQARPPWAPGGPGVWVREHSYLFHFVKGALEGKRRRPARPAPPSPVDGWTPVSVPGWESRTPEQRGRIRGQFAIGDLRPVLAGGEESERRLAATLRMIEARAALAHEKGAGFTLLLLPLKQEVLGAQRAELLALHGLTEEQLARPRIRLREHAARLGIRVLDATAALQADARPEELYWPVDLHMTPRGHARLAEIVAPVLDEGLAR